MKINLDQPSEEVQIQIIPLIDVIFCILTFFILAALQLTRPNAIQIDLPKASTSTTQMMRKMLVVNIDMNGRTFVDQQPVDQVQLYQLLQTYHQQNPDGLLVLNASQGAYYSSVVQVLDLMRLVGGDRVALATQPTVPNQTVPTPTMPGQTPTPFPSPGQVDLFGTPSPSPNPYFFPGSPAPLPGNSNINPTPGGFSPTTPTAPAPGTTTP